MFCRKHSRFQAAAVAPRSSPQRRSSKACVVSAGPHSPTARPTRKRECARWRRLCNIADPMKKDFSSDDPRAPGLALGMRRLSIIDLPGGHQPAWNEAKDVAVIFNGEIYNYRELRERLIRCGHRFATQSDTEILVHALGRMGRGVPDRTARDVCVCAARSSQTLRHRSACCFSHAIHWASSRCITRKRPKVLRLRRKCGALLAGGAAGKQHLARCADLVSCCSGACREPVTLLEGVFSLPPGHRMLLYVPERRRTPRARPWWDPRKVPRRAIREKPQDFSGCGEDDCARCWKTRCSAHLRCGRAGRIVSFQRVGFERDCGAGGASAAGHPELHARFSWNPLR